MFYCPRCKSQEIYAVAGGYIGQVYLCKDCGYRGSFVLDVEDAGCLGKTEREKKDEA
jgi:transposase-like protein